MNALDDHFLVTALGTNLLSVDGLPGTYNGLAIDSRRVNEGAIFLALPGSKTDGHNFIDAAQTKGAKAIICQADWTGKPQANVTYYRVQNTFDALRALATARRGQLKGTVVAVAGSVGKTTTKEMIASLFASTFSKVVATEGSQNGFLGIPLTILNTPIDCQVLVIEIGIDAPGAMIQHLEMVRPDAGIVTAIAPEHLEQLKDMETVAHEENLSLRWVHEHSGVAVINMDDPYIAPLYDELNGGQLISFGFTRGPTKKHIGGQIIPHGSEEKLMISGLGIEDYTLPLPLSGVHNARNLLGAVAIARHFGLTPKALSAGISKFTPLEGRSVQKILPSGALIFCDYYNASPAAMLAAFDTVAGLAQKRGGRILACIADMLELGDEEEMLHRNLATPIIEHRFDTVLSVGTRMTWLIDELKKRGFVGQIVTFPSPASVGKYLLDHLQPTDVVLMKGSRSMKMEEAYKVLLSHNWES
jgi:UDP-N-acetylmuramoyl-tripeptide--D-alanyl-D-alanine ligase